MNIWYFIHKHSISRIQSNMFSGIGEITAEAVGSIDNKLGGKIWIEDGFPWTYRISALGEDQKTHFTWG